MKIEEIYKLDLKKHEWDSIILNQVKKERHFLVLLSPIFAYAEDKILNIVCNSSVLINLVSKKLVNQHIYSSLTRLFLPILSRVCVYEMQYASKYKMLKTSTSESRFNEFIEFCKDEKTVFSLLQKYGVLKNLIERILVNFLDTNLELLQRLENDFSEISQTFNLTQNYVLKKIKNSGDLHNGGKGVTILRFENSEKKILKLFINLAP